MEDEQKQAEHAASARRTVLVRWRCPECRVSCAGYVEPTDYRPRRCQGIPESGNTGVTSQGKPICGAQLREEYRA